MRQDQEGYLWVGTEDGLFRYDGQRFQRFGESDGLPAAVARIMHTDGRHQFWIGTLKGLARWDGARFHRYGLAQGLPEKEIVHLAHGADGRIWTTIVGSAPLRLTAADRFEEVPGWIFGNCGAIGSSSRGRVWAASRTGDGGQARPHIVSFEDERWTEWGFDPGPQDDALGALLEDGEGRVWARGRKNLWVLEPGEKAFQLFSADLPRAEAIPRLELDHKGQLLVPTSGGLYWRDGGRWRIIGGDQGLPASWVRHAIMDREGSIWLAGMGIYRVLGRALWENFTVKDGLPGELVWSIAHGPDGRLWVGTNRGLAGATDKGWEAIPGTESYMMQSIAVAPDGTFLLTGIPPDVLHWDPKTQKLDKFATSPGVSSVNNVFRVVLDGEGNVWLGTGKGGLLRGAWRGGDLQIAREPLPRDKVDEMFASISLAPSGRLWASGENGLALREGGQWRRFTTADGLLADHVSHALETAAGDLYVAYLVPRGVSHFRYQNGGLALVEHPSSDDPALLPRVYSLTADSRGWLWIGNSRGIIVRGPRGEEHFTARDGIPSEDINNMAFLEAANGDVWFGTSGGLTRFHSAQYEGPLAPPRVWLGSSLLGERAARAGDRLEVPYRDNTFFSHFTSSSYAGEGKVQYQVKLSGLDSAWQSTESREARYPGLPAGRYAFEARSRVGSGGWGPAAKLDFQVLPAWYQTWWFKVAVGLAAGFGVYLIVLARIHALRKKNRLLEELVAERTRALNVANDELSSANANMRLVLDNVDQGLVMVDAKGGLTSERSAAFEAWFGKAPSGKHFAEHIAEDRAHDGEILKFGYEQVVEGLLPVELALDQMPKNLTRGDQKYTLAYKPVLKGERVEATLLMVSDVTSELEAQHAEVVQREQLKAFERIMRDRFGFLDFFRDAEGLVDRVCDGRCEDAEGEARAIHTLKGNAALFDVQSVAEIAHRLEQAMADGEAGIVARERQALADAWSEFAQRISPLVGESFEHRVDLGERELERLIAAARGKRPHAEIEVALRGLRGETVASRLDRVAEQVKGLSGRLGKGEPRIVILEDAVRLPRDRYADFWSSFAHVVRNVVDHGFETPEERRAGGKPEQNGLELSARAEQGKLVLEIADDGRGIPWDRVADEARQAGLPHATRAELMAALFHAGVSTARAITGTSGRGVGLAAVAEACRTLGGQIAVQSEEGKGTRFRFVLPLSSPEVDDATHGAELTSGVHATATVHRSRRPPFSVPSR